MKITHKLVRKLTTSVLVAATSLLSATSMAAPDFSAMSWPRATMISGVPATIVAASIVAMAPPNRVAK